MKSNEQLQKEVMDALKWEPQLHGADFDIKNIDTGKDFKE